LLNATQKQRLNNWFKKLKINHKVFLLISLYKVGKLMVNFIIGIPLLPSLTYVNDSSLVLYSALNFMGDGSNVIAPENYSAKYIQIFREMCLQISTHLPNAVLLPLEKRGVLMNHIGEFANNSVVLTEMLEGKTVLTKSEVRENLAQLLKVKHSVNEILNLFK
jgi:hypothetical protein